MVRVLRAGQVTDTSAVSGDDCRSATGEAMATVRLVGCGFPRRAHDIEVIIVDPTSFAVLPEDQVGEIWIRSPSKAAGYFGLPEKSLATFQALPAAVSTDGTPDVSSSAAEGMGAGATGVESDGMATPATPAVSSNGNGFLRTGDLGFYHERELFVCGRWKDLIIIRGRNHYPHDIEATVVSDQRLRPGCCSAFSFEQDGQEVLAILAEVRDGKVGVPIRVR